MALDTYKTQTDAGRNSQTSLTYDPVTRTWVASSPSNVNDTESLPQTDGESKSSQTYEKVSEPSSTSQVDSRTAAEKEYIETEFNTLTGDLVLTSTEKSIRIKVNDTIKIEGLGKYLSGLYFVSAIRRTLNKDSGYTHTLSLLKNGFGNSLKKEQDFIETRKEEVPKSSPDVKVGDSVRIVGDDAVYSNAHDGVRVPEWVKKKTLTVDGISSDGTRVRLLPIWSWTYLKYIQKV